MSFMYWISSSCEQFHWWSGLEVWNGMKGFPNSKPANSKIKVNLWPN